jgi:hypothetical protein
MGLLLRLHRTNAMNRTQGRTKRMLATARRLSVVLATSCARRRLIRDVRAGGGVSLLKRPVSLLPQQKFLRIYQSPRDVF